MAVIAFWSSSNKETGQTVSAAAIATYMAIEHNFRILLVDATFHDDTLERCFWTINKNKTQNITQKLNQGKIDISAGAEGLVSAIASNKATPEIITNYTRVVFKNRLDVLCGLKTKDKNEYLKTVTLYKDLLHTANKYYDLVFVDLEKTLELSTTKDMLEEADIIMYNFTKNLKQADEFLEAVQSNPQLLKKQKIIPLLSNSDENTPYNVKNVTRYIGERKEIPRIPYTSGFVKSISEAGVANYFLQNGMSGKSFNKNSELIVAANHACETIVKRLEELKYTNMEME